MNKECANPGCEKTFTPKTTAMVYCGEFCRKEATNNKAKKNYHEKKARKKGLLQRTCLKCNITKLSRYNKEVICEPCMAQPQQDARNTLLAQLGIVA